MLYYIRELYTYFLWLRHCNKAWAAGLSCQGFYEWRDSHNLRKLRKNIHTISSDDVVIYIRNIAWSHDATDHERALVGGNIISFFAWLKERSK